MALIIKYRPDNFDELLGNKETKEILKKFITKKEHPHTYLFYGERGLGKSTLARIMSKYLDCEVIEINGSNDRGIDTIRNEIYQVAEIGNLLSNKKNKSFILDEIHGMTLNAQESLLKILEEPPGHVYFFLCTTEPNKLRKTILSRCSQFEVERISNRDLYPFLIDISKRENNEISKQVARQIAETSEGRVRDALSILEKVLQIQDEEKQLKISKIVIDEEKTVIDLCRMLLNKNKFDNEIRQCLISLQNDHPESIRKIIINYMMKVILNSGNERAFLIIDELDSIIYDYAVLVKNIYRIFI